jgi:hypothetical protein
MISVLRSIAFRLALCALGTYAMYWVARRLIEPDWTALAFSMAMSAYFYGMALSSPLMDLVAELRHGARARIFKGIEGRFFAFHGHSVQVVEDLDHVRWVRMADVRKVLGASISADDEALRLTYGRGFAWSGKPLEGFLSDEALLRHLAKSRDPVALRLRHWVERDVVFPARRQRSKFGTNRDVPGLDSARPLGTEAFKAVPPPPAPTYGTKPAAAAPSPQDGGDPEAAALRPPAGAPQR